MRAHHLPFFAFTLALAAACGSSVDTTGGGGHGTTTTTTSVVPTDPKVPSEAAKAAVLVGSCLPDDGINRTLDSIYVDFGGSADGNLVAKYASCLAGKTNGCQGVQDCLGITVDLTGPCQEACNGSVLQGCDDTLKFQMDCAKVGLTCSVEAGSCIAEPLGAACDYDTFVPSCKDGAPVLCTDHETRGVTCADLGLVCGPIAFLGEPPSGDIGCAGTGPACETSVLGGLGVEFDQGIACDGAALRACVNGREHHLDCGTLGEGFTCQTAGSTAFCGLDGACVPGSATKATCEGDNVVICNAGRVEKIDCKSLGFTGCNATYGVCAPSVYPAN